MDLRILDSDSTNHSDLNGTGTRRKAALFSSHGGHVVLFWHVLSQEHDGDPQAALRNSLSIGARTPEPKTIRLTTGILPHFIYYTTKISRVWYMGSCRIYMDSCHHCSVIPWHWPQSPRSGSPTRFAIKGTCSEPSSGASKWQGLVHSSVLVDPPATLN